jgi:hypothetical protein
MKILMTNVYDLEVIKELLGGILLYDFVYLVYL